LHGFNLEYSTPHRKKNESGLWNCADTGILVANQLKDENKNFDRKPCVADNGGHTDGANAQHFWKSDFC
jgi:hypothetical protein